MNSTLVAMNAKRNTDKVLDQLDLKELRDEQPHNDLAFWTRTLAVRDSTVTIGILRCGRENHRYYAIWNVSNERLLATASSLKEAVRVVNSFLYNANHPPVGKQASHFLNPLTFGLYKPETSHRFVVVGPVTK